MEGTYDLEFFGNMSQGNGYITVYLNIKNSLEIKHKKTNPFKDLHLIYCIHWNFLEKQVFSSKFYCLFFSNRQLVFDEFAYSNNIQPVSRLPSGE